MGREISPLTLFYNFLKNKEWKAKIDRTGQMLMDFFDAELNILKDILRKQLKKNLQPCKMYKSFYEIF